MLVTVPFVLLLLDYCPLQRSVDLVALRKFAFEKIPLLVLAVASCVVYAFCPEGKGQFS
jgi:hypothetical protein